MLEREVPVSECTLEAERTLLTPFAPSSDASSKMPDFVN
jgi:hypothetical protein